MQSGTTSDIKIFALDYPRIPLPISAALALSIAELFKMTLIDVLLPTCNRLQSLIFTLSGIASQGYSELRVVIADQSDTPVENTNVVKSLCRIIQARGGQVEMYHRPQIHGIAEQRQFLLDRASSHQVLYLDDDVYMEPWVIEKLSEVLAEQRCGFVGAFPAGLSYVNDFRPDQQAIEYWDDKVHPEIVNPGTPEWERWNLHRAANLLHVAQQLQKDAIRYYKVAWIASCILYDRNKLVDVGGFNFWNRLPRYHSGEEVLVQNLLMRRWGGCGIVPSGTYYSELPSSVLNSHGSVDGHALELLPRMIELYGEGVQGRS
jgi:glycosyltransferase involved in cell wall biosynthesis